jgi:hypothetical protein
VPVKFRQFGDLIVARFAAAGYGKDHQVAAVANAIRESNLDPKAVSDPPERSFGLFQCNIHGGLGNGFSPDQLLDPEILQSSSRKRGDTRILPLRVHCRRLSTPLFGTLSAPPMRMHRSRFD